MIKAKGNSGSEKSPKPNTVRMFAGIKGLVASGPGMTKAVKHGKIRPEGAVSIDAGAVKPASGKGAMTQKSAGTIKPHGSAKVAAGARPEGATKRDSASAVKPFSV